jgi:hypothetical protein
MSGTNVLLPVRGGCSGLGVFDCGCRCVHVCVGGRVLIVNVGVCVYVWVTYWGACLKVRFHAMDQHKLIGKGAISGALDS